MKRTESHIDNGLAKPFYILFNVVLGFHYIRIQYKHFYLLHVYFMLSVTAVVLIGLGGGLLLFMLIPLCGYLFYDTSMFTRHESPLQGQAII
jgi:hypothetical protein